MIMFSPKTPLAQRHLFCSKLGMRMVDQLDNYLGLPLPIGRKKSLAFTNILDRCDCRINGWSKRLLSYGGKGIFIKTIIQSIPTYAFSIFLAPNGIIEKLHSKMCKQWWMNNEKTRGWVMLAWERMCYPKEWGYHFSGHAFV
ncbi:hypothetical protein V6Z11_A03G140300 [Gossypium hirsutum]